MNEQNIVAVKLTDDPRQRYAATSASPKAKLALRLKNDDWEISVFNGADKYILYTVLEKFNYGTR